MDARVFVTVFSTVFLAELGDKTQLATFLYAADAKNPKWAVWAGAVAALILASTIGVLAGTVLAKYLNPKILTRAAGLCFIALGVWTFWRA